MAEQGGIEFAHVSFSPASRPGEAASRPILSDVSLQITPATTTALLGRSGSGKTTLLRTVNGLVLPTAGHITVNGSDVSTSNLLKLRHGIGYVIQETGLFPHMSIERNVAMPLELAAQPLQERKRRAAEVLAMVGLNPEEFSGRMPWQLSGGQRQRAGLARALASNPSILLMDEPFGALDPLTRAEMQTMLRDLLHRLRKTALIVTHDLQEAIYLAQRTVFLWDGRIQADLASADVLTSKIEGVMEYVRAVNRFEEAR